MELIQIDPAPAWILRISLAVLFATGAAHKIRKPNVFLQTLRAYEILPRFFTIPGAVAIVGAELAVALGLLIHVDGYQSGLAAVSLLLIYTFAISFNLFRGRLEIDCGCLGPANRQPLSSWLVLRNGILIVGAAIVGLPITDRSLQSIDGISLAGGTLILIMLFGAINGLAAETGRWRESESVG